MRGEARRCVGAVPAPASDFGAFRVRRAPRPEGRARAAAASAGPADARPRRLLAQQTRDLGVPLDEYFFELQLTRGPCLLLVDGLDEAPNEAARETVSRLIEKAARAWPN